ncbi:WD40 repeat-containing protein [Tieghemostelium lacteum]|uniref:WD40 repeat-containing protein n=1 Tax=Tieghemostelium lacteum TaxID=361077 RepID=A0A152A293_TIELA|nr:WD40 repeat-containing protein [Tieghemostelium lacteum]|eukprot:KYR00329.1 WD40 repeat-containing protein [Tieghemostelium lacteum]
MTTSNENIINNETQNSSTIDPKELENIKKLCKLSIVNTINSYRLNTQQKLQSSEYQNNISTTSDNSDNDYRKIQLYSKIKDEYDRVKDMTPIVYGSKPQQQPNKPVTKQAGTTKPTVDKPTIEEDTQELDNLINSLPKQEEKKRKLDHSYNNALVIHNTLNTFNNNNNNNNATSNDRSLSLLNAAFAYDKPEWHPQWKLMRVVAGHTGWVRAISVDVRNEWFCTGSTDNTIKVWDLASGELKVTLTGHISAIRGLEVSSRHPYLFSVGEDNRVLCWDLEHNRQVRDYYGHSKGVYAVAMHPTLDILFTGGRDRVVRVWDIRTRAPIFQLQGHRNAVASLISQSADPQIISGSHDNTIRLWDLASGTSAATLTNHKSSIRAMVQHHKEYTFASAGSDNIKQWKCPEGAFIKNLSGHNSILNALALNQDNVLVSGGDNGTVHFWDWKSGYCFQKLETIAQPGSLHSEAGILAMSFDRTGSRLITCEADKSIKFYKEDDQSTPQKNPIASDWKPSFDNKRY